MEKSIVRNVIDTEDVICTTTTIDDDLLSDSEFDVVVIDHMPQRHQECGKPYCVERKSFSREITRIASHCAERGSVTRYATFNDGRDT